MSGLSIAKSLELHLARPGIARSEVQGACELAAEHHLAAVLVHPVHVEVAARVLDGSDALVGAAIGFPWGQDTVETRRAAADRALADGADELALMLDHSALVDGDVDRARRELEQLLSAAFWSSLVATRGRRELTIVVETTMLELEPLRPLLALLHDSPAGFVQTGTGQQPRSVTEHHLADLRAVLPDDIAIRAVGGIATLEDATALLSAGAARIGSGSAVAIAGHERRVRAGR